MKIDRAANGMLTYTTRAGQKTNCFHELTEAEQLRAAQLLTQRGWEREYRILMTKPYRADFVKGRRKS